jgi:hypothetical protein
VSSSAHKLEDKQLRILGCKGPKADWGFIPATAAEDGDPLDVMVIHDAATFPGLVLTCKIIGVFQVEQHSKGKKSKPHRTRQVPYIAEVLIGMRCLRNNKQAIISIRIHQTRQQGLGESKSFELGIIIELCPAAARGFDYNVQIAVVA